jgi:hypothetical protein
VNYSSKIFIFKKKRTNSLFFSFYSLVKKLHRHTNAHRQLVFDILSSKTGLSASILITRARLLLLNDYESSMISMSLNELKEKLKIEINRSLEFHIQAHEQAIKFVVDFFRWSFYSMIHCREWQQKMIENPSKDKNRGPRKNFRLYKTIKYLKRNVSNQVFSIINFLLVN